MQSLAVSSSGANLVSADESGRVIIWNLTSRTPLRSWQAHKEAVRAVALDTTGTVLVTGSTDKTARLWDLLGKQLAYLMGHKKGVHAATFLPKQGWAATGSVDGSSRLWSVPAGKMIRLVAGPAGAYDIAFTPDGRFLACSTRLGVLFYDPASGRLVKSLEGQGAVDRLAMSPKGDLVASSSYFATEVTLWNHSSLTMVRQLPGHATGRPKSVSFSGDGTLLAVGDKGVLKLWDVQKGTKLKDVRVYTSPIGWIQTVSFNSASKVVATGNLGDSTYVQLWSVPDLAKITSVGRGPFAFHPNGKWIGVGFGLADVKQGTSVRAFKPSGKGSARAITFSKSGRTLAVMALDGYYQAGWIYLFDVSELLT